MKTKGIVAAAVLGVGMMAGSAHAQFDGFYVGGGVGFYKGTVEISEPGFEVNLGDNKHRPVLSLNAGYGHSMGNFHVAGEFNYLNEMGRIKASIDGEDFSAKLKDVWALSILPGYKLSNTTLAFARLGYAKAKGDFEGESEKFRGTLYGIGVKHAFNRNLSGVIEYQNLVLKAKEGVKPAASGVMVGVQYGF